MKIPRRGEKGFTLVELLIVLAILAVLAAVVIPNVIGMMGRGSEQAFHTDGKTITTSVATFYFDIHSGDVGVTDPGGWNSLGTAGHKYPTKDGKPSELYVDGDGVLNGVASGADETYFDGGENGAIWMGLLVNVPSDGGAAATPSNAHPLVYEVGDPAKTVTEDGPYLNEFPKSSSAACGNSGDPGTYTWVVGKNGSVFAVFWDVENTKWEAGFGGNYP